MQDWSKDGISEQAERLVERLAEQVGMHARPSTVFGEAVERDGVTVIPVARVRYGFGGGGGGGRGRSSAEGEGEGGGGGGGMTASPLGYIEISGGEAVFRRIHDPASLWPTVLAAAFTAWVVLRGIRRILRG
ncbi:MAG: spore germination protein GerW family protein [Dehalococcoidia bacterium]|nr:spore germination protein GerW family protein [Dehalococcoidia bacterium]